MPQDKTIYEEHGFKDREDYLNNLAEEHGVPAYMVFEAAYMLGEGEDFDGLVASLDLI